METLTTETLTPARLMAAADNGEKALTMILRGQNPGVDGWAAIRQVIEIFELGLKIEASITETFRYEDVLDGDLELFYGLLSTAVTRSFKWIVEGLRTIDSTRLYKIRDALHTLSDHCASLA